MNPAGISIDGSKDVCFGYKKWFDFFLGGGSLLSPLIKGQNEI